MSEVEVTFPIVLKTDEKDFVRREIVANVINLDEVNFRLERRLLKNGRPK